VLVQLANKTIATAQRIAVRGGFVCRIRKRGTRNGIVRRDTASMSVRRFNGGPVDNETQQ
jgi:hypothetical protein